MTAGDEVIYASVDVVVWLTYAQGSVWPLLPLLHQLHFFLAPSMLQPVTIVTCVERLRWQKEVREVGEGENV